MLNTITRLLIVFNIIFFIIFNIPIFKYLCDINYFYTNYQLYYFISYYLYLKNEIYFNIYFYTNNVVKMFLSHQLKTQYVIVSEPFYIIYNKYNLYTLKLYFKATLSNHINDIHFISLQEWIYCINNEINLIFFRIINNTCSQFQSFILYLTFPSDLNAYINKIQCFCFENLFIQSFEMLDLPIIFYICISENNVYNSGILNYILFNKL